MIQLGEFQADQSNGRAVSDITLSKEKMNGTFTSGTRNACSSSSHITTEPCFLFYVFICCTVHANSDITKGQNSSSIPATLTHLSMHIQTFTVLEKNMN